MKVFLRVALATLFMSVAALASAQSESAASTPAARAEAPGEQKLEIPGVNLTHGPTTVKLGTVAELKLPEGHAFVGPDSLDKFFELTHNFRNGNEVGVVIAPGYMLYFDYDAIGYVKDDEKKDLDADKLYKSMEEGQKAGNEERKRRGWSELRMAGWTTKPHYDEKTNNLKWAFKLSSSEDNYKETWINENIRLLGRGGVMNVTLVSSNPDFKATEVRAEELLASFAYLPGQKYAEYKSGDKVAAYGLTALVLGGAGAVALKTGLLAKLGYFLAKSWKLVVVGVVALGAGLLKIFNKISGKNPS
jgi:uncharacterized membrane-anchored protein